MWRPILDISYVIDKKATKVYGSGYTTNLRYWGNQLLAYHEGSKLTFSCDFQLSYYPFDSHECKLYIGSHQDDTSKLKLIDLWIQYHTLTTSIEEESIIMNKLFKSYEVKLETLPQFEYFSIIGNNKHKFTGNYSYTGMKMKLKRKSLGHLTVGYYYPTASFSLLSMISYLINPDIVSNFSKSNCKFFLNTKTKKALENFYTYNWLILLLQGGSSGSHKTGARC